jgi:hypothetical protein
MLRRRTDPECAHETQATELNSSRHWVHVPSHAKCRTERRGSIFADAPSGTAHVQHENDDKGCHGHKYCEWYETSYRGEKKKGGGGSVMSY